MLPYSDIILFAAGLVTGMGVALLLLSQCIRRTGKTSQ
jgi:hypothetical protein